MTEKEALEKLILHKGNCSYIGDMEGCLNVCKLKDCLKYSDKYYEPDDAILKRAIEVYLEQYKDDLNKDILLEVLL